MKNDIIKDLIRVAVKYDLESPNQLIYFLSDQDEINSNVKEMLDNGYLEVDESRVSSLQVVHKVDTSQYEVEEIRKYFKKSYSGYTAYSGTKKLVHELIGKYMYKHPEHTWEAIVNASKSYVDYCLNKGQYLKKIQNFIVEDLESVIEDLEDQPRVNVFL